jgi:sialidase-1
MERLSLFEAGDGAYAIYRIPGIVVTAAGTLLVCCEARRSARGDWGAIDLLLRRSASSPPQGGSASSSPQGDSADGGRTWEPPRRMNRSPEPVKRNPAAPDQSMAAAGQTCNNPLLIADRQPGRVHFLYCVEYARCFYRSSQDDGVRWSEPLEITSALQTLQPRYPWRVCALGPGHGIQLSSGRLLVPVWLSPGTGGHAHRPSAVASIYSDDGGLSWHAGEIILEDGPQFANPSETALVELSDGRVMANIRTESAFLRRVTARSPDGARAWSPPRIEQDLFDPVCFAGLTRFSAGKLLFSNPDSLSTTGPGSNTHTEGPRPPWGYAPQGTPKGRRENLTVRLSEDDGRTWPTARVVDPGLAGYSDLASAPDGTIYCFYEGGGIGGDAYASAHLWLARFDMAWLRDG